MKHAPLVIITLLILLAAGCSSPDERLAHLAEATSTQQAQQNQAVTELNREAGENHRRVVEAVEQSRQSIVFLERDLQLQRDTIDQERRSLANERHLESLLGPVLNSLGMLMVAALPLVLCWYLLHGVRGQNDQEEISGVLIQELAASESPLLPSPDRREAIGHEEASAEAETTETPPF